MASQVGELHQADRSTNGQLDLYLNLFLCRALREVLQIRSVCYTWKYRYKKDVSFLDGLPKNGVTLIVLYESVLDDSLPK